MDWSFIQNIPKDHAALIGAIVTASAGFVGVIITLFWNAWLGRRADRRKFDAEQQADRRKFDAAQQAELRKLDHEKHVLRTALRAELRNLVRTIAGELEWLAGHQATWVPVLDFFGVYRENLDKLGYLYPDEVDAIADAYYSYQERMGYIARHGQMDLSKPITGSNIHFDFGENDLRKRWVASDLNIILQRAKFAIHEIEEQLIKTGHLAKPVPGVAGDLKEFFQQAKLAIDKIEGNPQAT